MCSNQTASAQRENAFVNLKSEQFSSSESGILHRCDVPDEASLWLPLSLSLSVLLAVSTFISDSLSLGLCL